MAIGLIPDMLNAFFGSKKKTTPSRTVPENIPLTDFFKTYLSKYQPGKAFSGSFAPMGQMTEYEQSGFNRLNNLLTQAGTGDLFAGAEKQVSDTLSGQYADPMTSPFIKSMINLSKMNLSDAINETRARRGSRGTYFTEEGIREEGRLGERTMNYLDTVVGDFMNKERDRQFRAVPLAQGLDKYKNRDIPMENIESLFGYGSLPRTLQTAQLEAEYQDFNRQQEELAGVASGAKSIYQPSVTYPGSTQEVPTTFGKIYNVVDALNQQLIGAGGTEGLKKEGGGFDIAKILKLLTLGTV